MIEYAIAIFLGLIIGCITGLTPGIHINLVSAFLLGISGFLLSSFGISGLVLAVFLICVAITHVFVDFIPSIFLGAPAQDDTALAILPGHEMLARGEGYKAVILSFYGCLIGIFMLLFFIPLFLIFLPSVYALSERIMPLVLLLISFFLIYFEKSSKLWAFLIFIFSGLLGLVTFNLGVRESLLPLFTGLFGISSLITSVNQKTLIPLQKKFHLKDILPSKLSIKKIFFASSISAPLCSFLPGMGSGQAAVMSSQIVSDFEREEFLILLGALNILILGLSFPTFFLIDKARTGIALAVGKIIPFDLNIVFLISFLFLFCGFFSFLFSIFLAQLFSKIISVVNYSKLSFCIILFLIFLNIYLCGIYGLFILVCSTFLGLTCIYSGVRRTHLMGCLILPAFLFALF
jgi:putative membrane protein